MKDLNVIIVGAGIGGLQAALALANDGHSVTVLESAKSFEEVGMHKVVHISTPLTVHRSVLGFVFPQTPSSSATRGASILAMSLKSHPWAIAS